MSATEAAGRYAGTVTFGVFPASMDDDESRLGARSHPVPGRLPAVQAVPDDGPDHCYPSGEFEAVIGVSGERPRSPRQARHLACVLECCGAGAAFRRGVVRAAGSTTAIAVEQTPTRGINASPAECPDRRSRECPAD